MRRDALAITVIPGLHAAPFTLTSTHDMALY